MSQESHKFVLQESLSPLDLRDILLSFVSLIEQEIEENAKSKARNHPLLREVEFKYKTNIPSREFNYTWTLSDSESESIQKKLEDYFKTLRQVDNLWWGSVSLSFFGKNIRGDRADFSIEITPGCLSMCFDRDDNDEARKAHKEKFDPLCEASYNILSKYMILDHVYKVEPRPPNVSQRLMELEARYEDRLRAYHEKRQDEWDKKLEEHYNKDCQIQSKLLDERERKVSQREADFNKKELEFSEKVKTYQDRENTFERRDLLTKQLELIDHNPQTKHSVWPFPTFSVVFLAVIGLLWVVAATNLSSPVVFGALIPLSLCFTGLGASLLSWMWKRDQYNRDRDRELQMSKVDITRASWLAEMIFESGAKEIPPPVLEAFARSLFLPPSTDSHHSVKHPVTEVLESVNIKMEKGGSKVELGSKSN